jgi:L-rhamnose isomerase
MVRDLGFPVATALALAFWTWYQDKTSRAERTAERMAFTEALMALVGNDLKREASIQGVDEKVVGIGEKLDALLARRSVRRP